MSNNRRSPFIRQLCPSLELRYSISVVAAPKEKYACGYFNSARYYLYSTATKKKIGKHWQATYRFTKKAIKAANGSKPTVYEPKETDLQEALENLLNLNIDLPESCKQKRKKTTIQVKLNTDELFVFWITHFTSIYSLVSSSQTPVELNKRMAKVFMNHQIASFDLSSFAMTQQNLLESAGKSLVSHVKKTITGSTNTLTHGVYQTVQLIRYTVQCYLAGKNISSMQVQKILLRESRVKAGPVSKAASAMRLKSIPISRYRELWSALTELDNVENVALLLMIFLGLTSEEVCGLQTEDYRMIPDRQGFYQLRITHKYSKEQAKKYSLEILDDEYACRNIPVPFQIRRIIDHFYGNAKNNSSPYLFQNRDSPLNPEVLNQKLNELLETPTNNLSIKTNHNKYQDVNVAFQAKAYRESCRYYWQYHCGLTEGEICYLSALSPPDTAAGHYIDFNNGSVQYRMLKQIEYGIAIFASIDKHDQSHREWCTAPRKAFYSSGTLDKRASMDLHVIKPVELEISSNRGIIVYMEEDEEKS